MRSPSLVACREPRKTWPFVSAVGIRLLWSLPLLMPKTNASSGVLKDERRLLRFSIQHFLRLASLWSGQSRAWTRRQRSTSMSTSDTGSLPNKIREQCSRIEQVFDFKGTERWHLTKIYWFKAFTNIFIENSNFHRSSSEFKSKDYYGTFGQYWMLN